MEVLTIRGHPTHGINLGLFVLVWGSLVVGIMMILVEWMISCYTLIDRSNKAAPQNLLEVEVL